jgi:hypothetical protein
MLRSMLLIKMPSIVIMPEVRSKRRKSVSRREDLPLLVEP